MRWRIARMCGAIFAALRDHGAVDVADLPARSAHAPRGFGQQRDRIGALETFVGIGEMVANVAERRGAEQGFGDRVAQGIRIRVTEQAERVRDLDAAEDQAAAGTKRMHVPAFADAPQRGGGLVHVRILSSRAASSKSAG